MFGTAGCQGNQAVSSITLQGKRHVQTVSCSCLISEANCVGP